MKRPLVWAGIAYISGEVLAITGCRTALVLAVMVMIMIILGRLDKKLALRQYLIILPFLFFTGYESYVQAEAYPDFDSCFETSLDVTYSGIVADAAVKENSIALQIDNASVVFETDDGRRYQGSAGLILYADLSYEGSVKAGDEISGSAELEKMEKASDPGQFDTASYYHAQGIDYTGFVNSLRVLSREISYGTFLKHLRSCFEQVYGQVLCEDDAGVMDAMILGDKALLDDEIKEMYQSSGIIHVLAISGLHISIIGMGVFKALCFLGLPFPVSGVISGFMVISFGMMIGAKATSIRAIIMFLVRMGAEFTGRSYDMLSGLSLSALLILIWHPLMLTQAGFQFSYAAILSLGVLWKAADEAFEKAIHHEGIKKVLFKKLGPAFSATLGTIPLTAFYYGKVPLYSLFLNLLILPLMSILVPLGMLTGMAGAASLTAGGIAAFPVHLILSLNTFLCECVSHLPGAVWVTGSPPAGLVVFCYAVMALTVAGLHFTGYRHFRLSYLLFICLVILIPFRRMSSLVLFIDVGQGDGIFIRSLSGTTYLIDGGSTTVTDVGKYRIDPLLTFYGETGIDYALVSHGDEDHLSGVRELLEEGKIRHLVLTEVSKGDDTCQELAKMAESADIPVIYLEKGDGWEDGGWKFDCLFPDDGQKDAEANDQSMVIKLTTEDKKFLFTGDITASSEMLLDTAEISDIDVLKIAHHGSAYSSCSAFLKETGAGIAVISAGLGNRYGHPAPETLERISDAGMYGVSTIEHGAIIFEYRHGRFQMHTME